MRVYEDITQLYLHLKCPLYACAKTCIGNRPKGRWGGEGGGGGGGWGGVGWGGVGVGKKFHTHLILVRYTVWIA